MRDTELYQQVLGLTAPWSVDRVESKIDDGRVDIWVRHEPAQCWAGSGAFGQTSPFAQSNPHAWLGAKSMNASPTGNNRPHRQ